MILLRATSSQRCRRWAALILLVLGCSIFPIGCGEPAVQESSMPPKEFVDKLEAEHPELFVKKIGKNKTEVLGGRDKRKIIREEWQKSQGK